MFTPVVWPLGICPAYSVKAYVQERMCGFKERQEARQAKRRRKIAKRRNRAAKAGDGGPK